MIMKMFVIIIILPLPYLPLPPCWAWGNPWLPLSSQTFMKHESHPLLLPELYGMLSIKN